MFANRITVVVDACSLVSPLPRNVLLSLAEAAFFSVRWSARILGEVERAVARLYGAKGVTDAEERARRVRAAMDRAFPDALITGADVLEGGLTNFPDPDDAHVIAAAVNAHASLIVTENKRHFPDRLLDPLGLEAKRADAFIADMIDLDVGLGVAAVRVMRARLSRPALDPPALLSAMERVGLTETADTLRPHIRSL